MDTRKLSTTSLSLIALFFVLLGVSSCKKPCDLNTDDSDNGAIISGAIIYPLSGGLTESLNGHYVVDGSTIFSDQLEMRLSISSPRVPVDYSQYTVLANPLTVNCNVAFERTVTIDDVNSTVNYHVVANQCANAKCDEKRSVENWILVPAFPDTYTVTFTHEVKNL